MPPQSKLNLEIWNEPLNLCLCRCNFTLGSNALPGNVLDVRVCFFLKNKITIQLKTKTKNKIEIEIESKTKAKSKIKKK